MATAVDVTRSAPSGATLRAGLPVPPLALGNARVAIWGQSNAVGRALRSDLSASPLSADAGLVEYDAGTFTRVYIYASGGYQLLTPDTNNGSTSGQFGPEFGLAVEWERRTEDGLLFIEKQASSGVSIDPNFISPSGYNYTQGVAVRGAGNTWLSNNGGITIDRECLLWAQGESDYLQTQAWYETRLSGLLSALVSAGLLDANSRIVLSQMAVGSDQYGAGVAAAKTAIAAASEYAQDIAFPYYMKTGDNLHYNGRGQVQHAYDAFAWLFDTTASST